MVFFVAIFKRSNRTQGMDQALPTFSAHNADEFRTMVARAYADAGIAVSVAGDTALTPRGGTYNLREIALTCSASRQGSWARTLRSWVSAVADLNDTDPAHLLTADVVRRSLVARLWSVDAMPAKRTYAYAEEFVPGVVVAMTLDLPDRVLLDDHMVEFLASTTPDFRDVARDNLKNLLFKEPIVGQSVDIARAEFDVLASDSFYMASHATELASTIARVTDCTDFTAGIVFSIPTRHQIMFHIVDEDRDAQAAIEVMADCAYREFAGSPAGLSGEIYLWLDGQVHRIPTASTVRHAA